jgi:hypothetical protein
MMAFIWPFKAQLVSAGFLGGNAKPMNPLLFQVATRLKI